MSDRYREKVCPVCSVIHRKRNEYCSKACSNRGRTITDETKQKLSVRRKEYLQTPEGIATVKRTSEINANPENTTIPMDEYAVDIPDLPDILDLPDGYDIADRW